MRLLDGVLSRAQRRLKEREFNKQIAVFQKGQSDDGSHKLIFVPTNYAHEGCGGDVEQATHYRMRSCMACNSVIRFEAVEKKRR